MTQQERTDIINSLAKEYEAMCEIMDKVDFHEEWIDEAECIVDEFETDLEWLQEHMKDDPMHTIAGMYYKMGKFDVLTRDYSPEEEEV